MKCLECAINPLLHSLSGSASNPGLFLLWFLQMASFFKARINRQFHRPGNLKGVAGFKILNKLYPYKCRSKSPTSSTFAFNRLSNSNVKVHTIFLRNMVFVVTTKVCQLDDQVLAKRGLLRIIDKTGTPLFCACGDYMWS